jgi:SAM-dependent methyltransferase
VDVPSAFGDRRAYEKFGIPPWETGQPQPEFLRLAAEGQIESPVLEVRCRLGENALHLSSIGYEVLGVDKNDPGIGEARAIALERGLAPHFLVRDPLELTNLGRSFATAISSGLFQRFTEEEGLQFAKSLRGAMRDGGKYYQLNISDLELGPVPPNKVKRDQLTRAFGEGWQVEWIREARYLTTLHPDGAPAWLACMTAV